MRWSVKVARVSGIDVKIHLTFLLLLSWLGYVYYVQGGMPAAFAGLSFILLLFLCVLLHEFGHAMAARYYGIRTPDITLLPIGGLARMERIPDKPVQELVIAIAGPMVNVVIALVLFIALGGDIEPADLVVVNRDGGGIMTKLLAVNVVLVLFNLIPALPMDGGRVLRALLAMRMEYARATTVAAHIGQGIAFLFGIWGLFGGNFMLLFVAFFVYMGASQEASLAQIKSIAEGMLVRDAMITNFVTLQESSRLEEGVRALLDTSQHEFPVVDSEGTVVGMLTRNDLIGGLERGGTQLPVVDVMRRDLPMVHASSSFNKAFELMQQCQCPALPVTDNENHIVGIITTENVGEMLMINSAIRHSGRTSLRSRWPGASARG